MANVRDAAYGATGNGLTDDTAAIQRALDAVGGSGGTVRVPAGTYRINALAASGRGLVLRSNLTLALDPGAVLQAIPNGASNYAILSLVNVDHVTVTGGVVEGERAAHTGTTGEWGHGIVIGNARQVVLAGLTVRECWGDGIDLYGTSSNVTLCGVMADHNRRQGLSITGVDGLVVRDSTFKNTGGTLPEDGIDIEPNAGETVTNVLITGCSLLDNAGYGLEDGVPIANSGAAFATAITVEGTLARGNGVGTLSASARGGFAASNSPAHVFRNNTLTGNRGYGLLLREHADRFQVTGNSFTGNTGDGLLIYLCDGDTITGNTVTGNGGHGIYPVSSTNVTLTGNTVSGNGSTP